MSVSLSLCYYAPSDMQQHQFQHGFKCVYTQLHPRTVKSQQFSVRVGLMTPVCIGPTTINLDDGNRGHCSARLKIEDSHVLCHGVRTVYFWVFQRTLLCSRSCSQTATWTASPEREFWSNSIPTWTGQQPKPQQAKETSHSLSNRAQEASLNNPIRSQLTHSHPPTAIPPHLPSCITTCQSQPLHQTPHTADHYHPLSALPPSSSTSV